MPAPLKLFGQAVRRERTLRDWTQETLAEAADLHENYISRLETGEQEPGLLVILKLCRAFEITPSMLLSEFTTSVLARLQRT